ncbi:Nicotinate-nucleotide--dimethylbenzimidazole phosphoribosyltransferase [hydrothermal vent metagenome]|uniref:Nicotinate-nucleotide--dimethylbenzimidazole phosphoribosyltransferase n=1 Tax=hydrothermal vent metagenome TaxID=652676 RepID=A0A3B1DJ50_9ZZZZ
MNHWITKAQNIKPINQGWIKKAQARLDEQTRPQGSLGMLEGMITNIVAITEKERPSVKNKKIFIFAADHGVEAEGISLFPKEVTTAMVMNFLNEGATINALARQINADISVVDVGVDADLGAHDQLINAKVRKGTRNFKLESAMTEEELDQALQAGWNVVQEAKAKDVDLIGLGEMGIGNTTTASAVIAAALNVDALEVTGRGTGLDEKGVKHKANVINVAIEQHQAYLKDPLAILQHVGGYEVAAMTGAILACATLRIPVVIDGWIVAASALIAYQLNPAILDYFILSHQSEEKGHQHVLKVFQKKPLLDLSMRLGEASGAALSMSLIESGMRIYNEVATFAEAQVAGKKEEGNVT